MKILQKIAIFFFLVVMQSVVGQSGKIVISKEQAIKKGIYSPPSTENSIAVAETPKPEKEKKQNAKPKQKKEKNNILVTKNDDDIIISNETDSYIAEQLIYNASDNLGIKYRSGGTTREGFDCSGLMYSTFKKFDITLPRSSYEMALIGRKIEPTEYKKGDLIFFRTFGGSRISHVGMITEVNGDEIKFIHSSTQLGVIVSSLKEPYYQRTFAQVNRVLE